MAFANEVDSDGALLNELSKLYAPLLIGGLTEQVVIINPHMLLLKPIEFIDSKGKSVMRVTYGNRPRCHNYNHRLWGEYKKAHLVESGLSSYLVIDRSKMNGLVKTVEEEHKGIPMWKVFIASSNGESQPSVDELYFNYALLTYPERVKIKPYHSAVVKSLSTVHLYRENRYDLVEVSDISIDTSH